MRKNFKQYRVQKDIYAQISWLFAGTVKEKYHILQFIDCDKTVCKLLITIINAAKSAINVCLTMWRTFSSVAENG